MRMDRPLSKEMMMREIVALMEETVRLFGKVAGELGRYIAERKRLADQASPPVLPAAEELRRETGENV
jgi:hypothetical protein